MPHRIFNFFLNLIFPQECLFCHKEMDRSYPLCRDCEKQIPLFSSWIVPPSTKYLSALGTASSYKNAILRATIHCFKYRKIISLQYPLAGLLIKFIENNNYLLSFQQKDIYVIPIPLSKKKQRQRGFNQVDLIAQIISKHFHWNYIPDALQRIKDNPPQAQIEDTQRRKENVKGIFQMNPLKQNLTEKIVIIVDDVYTSGATMEEAARILKKTRVKKIIGLVLAQ